MGSKKEEKLTIQSISYVHDPEAATKWMEIFTELIKEEFEKSIQEG